MLEIKKRVSVGTLFCCYAFLLLLHFVNDLHELLA